VGTEDIFHRGKVEVEDNSPSSAKVKNKQNYTSITAVDLTFTLSTIWRLCYTAG
jgi:hypothetical protein